MAASVTNMLTIPSSKITLQTSTFHTFSTPPSPLTRNQKSIKLVARDTSSLSRAVTDHVPDKSTNKPKQLAEVWREIQGQNNWAGLLEPMDSLLKTEVIRYGEMAQACYDAFNFDLFSKYCGTCKFARSNFFNSLQNSQLYTSHFGYNVTRYLHVTANINFPNCFIRSRYPKEWSKVNWAGYVAVSDDATTRRLGRRDITIAWRGTVTKLEWVADLIEFLKPVSSHGIPCHDHWVKVESGFLELYTDKDESNDYCNVSAREQVLAEVKSLVEKYRDEEVSITITGHSLGSALAILNAYDIVETGVNVVGNKNGKGVGVTVMSFSGPRVGNVRFKERLEKLGVKVLRVVNVHDVVPTVPGLVFNEHLPLPLPWCYSHVGVEVALDHKKSPFLNPHAHAASAHNLEALLHLLDGYHGKGETFNLENGRDPALVNKGCDFLKDNYLIPPNWMQDENRGLVRRNGHWVQPERPVEINDHPKDMHLHLRQLGLASFDEIYMNEGGGGDSPIELLEVLPGEN